MASVPTGSVGGRRGGWARGRRRLRARLERLEPKLAPAGGTIAGVVYNDLNADGARETGEPGVSGRTVFVDLNQNGQPDSGEPTATTGADGSYLITGLAGGTYQVAQVLPPGWKQTAPSGSTGATPQTVTLAAGTTSSVNVQSYASTSDQNIPAYHQYGYTLSTSSTNPTVFTIYGSGNTARYAGQPALSSEWAPSTITLTRDDGTPFTLNAMDLSTIWSSIYNVTVSFTGHRADGSTVQQSFAIGSQLGFHHVTFTGFTNLTSVTWNSTGTSDYHQFTNVSVTGGDAGSASGVNFGTTSVPPPAAIDDSYTLDENTPLTTANPLVNSLTMTSQPGDYIGQGRSYSYGPSSGVYTATGGGNGNHVGIAYHTPNYSDWWYLDFAAPNGAPLAPGTYTGAARYPFQAASQPGLDVSGEGRGSNTLTGQFTVTQAVFDASGSVLSFAANFEQHSEGATPALTGTVTYQAPNAPPPGVLANDSGTGLTAVLVTGPAHGTLALNPDGTFTYTPATNYYGTDSFTYTADSGGTASAPATVTLTVNHVNQPPTVAAQSYGAAKNQALAVAAPGVLSGASDPDPGTTLTARLVSGPSHGSLVLNPDGSFTYTPAANYLGPDQFQFAASDGALSSKPAAVSLTVTGPDDPPVARDDQYLVAQGATLSPVSGVLANDSDPNGQPLTAALLAGSGPAHGTLTLNPNGTFVYTPAAGYHGPDSFQYQAGDGTLQSNVATVTITVDAPPVVVADSYATDEDVPLTVAAPGVLGNDSDADGDPLTAMVYSPPAHGTIAMNPDGSFTYTPALHYSGTDSFQYRVTDGKLTSAPVTDTITVRYVNYPPTANDDFYTVPEDSSLSAQAAVTSYAAQSDPGDYIGGGGTYSYGTGDATFTVSRNYDNGVSVRVVPVNNPAYSWSLDFAAPGNVPLTPGVYNGATRFPFQSTTQPGLSVTYYDRGSNTLTGSFTVYQADYDAKGNVLSFDASYVMHNEGMTPALSGRIRYRAYAGAAGVLFNDSDVENEPLTARLVSGPSHGTLALNADGSFTYTPAPLYSGPDSFTYVADDGAGTSAPATAMINVAHVNHPPVTVAESFRVGQGKALALAAPGVLGNDTDPDGDPLRAVLVAGPAHGTLTLNADGSFAYTPDPGYAGPDGFQYKANDGLLDGPTVTDTIAVDAPPVASDDAVILDANTSAGLTLAASDPDGDPLAYTILSGPSHGTLSGTAPGLTYTPDPNFVGADSVTFKVNDGLLDSNVATVSITVTHPPMMTPTVTWAPPADIPFGTPLGAAQLDATASVPGTFIYSPSAGAVLDVGPNQTLSVTFTPDDTFTYSTTTATTTINVVPATPVVAWAPPADITYGTPLGAAQLDASASVPGTWTYSPAAGAVLHAGAGQALSATFTPTDAAHYATVTDSTAINVLKATPSVSWSPAGLTYGTPLGAAQLDATSTVVGSFAYTPAAGTVLHAGTWTLSTTFTPADADDYNPVTASDLVAVARARLLVTPVNQDMGHGDAVPALTAALSGFVNGDTAQAVSGAPALSTSATSTSPAGSYPITASAGTLSAADYDFAFAAGTLTVHPRVLDVRVHWGSRTMSLVGLGRDLPFTNITAVDVLFSDDVTVTAGDLALTSTTGSGRSYGFSRFSYSAANADATWTLPSAIGIDRLMLALDNQFGARVDPSISVWNSTPLRFSVLPGDFDGDGAVTNSDWQGVKRLVGAGATNASAVWADLDGSGYVDQKDVNAAKSRTGTKLP